ARLSLGLGRAVYEDGLSPEFWVYAQKGEDAMRPLVPGGAEALPELPPVEGESEAARLYAEQVRFAFDEEYRRRASRVIVKANELSFQPTAMGSLAYVVDSRIGFHVKALSTLVAQIPPGQYSGAHRHL